MKTDSIFYRLFQEFPSIFFELIGNPPETAEVRILHFLTQYGSDRMKKKIPKKNKIPHNHIG